MVEAIRRATLKLGVYSVTNRPADSFHVELQTGINIGQGQSLLVGVT